MEYDCQYELQHIYTHTRKISYTRQHHRETAVAAPPAALRSTPIGLRFSRSFFLGLRLREEGDLRWCEYVYARRVIKAQQGKKREMETVARSRGICIPVPFDSRVGSCTVARACEESDGRQRTRRSLVLASVKKGRAGLRSEMTARVLGGGTCAASWAVFCAARFDSFSASAHHVVVCYRL